MIRTVLSGALALGIAAPASAQTLTIPVLKINMHQVANKKIKGARPHMIYQNTFYKGLDASL
ncbi:hypothetical protein [Bradyrhizobium sp.]|jgi:peptide/nickel transport system substrate-binding protein|uniref:hypothetical protein n=1 Tax=Bradyrhizobium sp. TaxID=376 RepID=UPI002DF8B2AC|nr:hypothetical protein [Bradyrhizobium sp.]